MLKIIITIIAFCTSFSYAGTIEKDSHFIEFNKKLSDEVFTKYCFENKCNEKTVSFEEFSLKMDEVTLFVENIYEKKGFYENFVYDSFKDYKKSKEKIWVLDFKGIATFSVEEDQYDEVIASKEKISSLLYAFYRRITSEEFSGRFKEILNSNEKINLVDDYELNFYKNISQIIIENKV
jgi:hypothetical protein